MPKVNRKDVSQADIAPLMVRSNYIAPRHDFSMSRAWYA